MSRVLIIGAGALIGLWLTVQLTEATVRYDLARADVAGRRSAEQQLRAAHQQITELKQQIATCREDAQRPTGGSTW